jgi:hypothetical protein
MAQKLKFGNGTFATKEGSTLAYNDENNNYKPLPFTTTRNSIATRVNKEGLIEVVGSDVPRIDYTDSADGALLLENSSTNILVQSNKFDTSWTLSNVSVLGNQTGVGGSIDAWKLSANNGSGEKKMYVGASSGTQSISIYAKAGTRDYLWLRGVTSGQNKRVFFNLSNGIIETDDSISSEIIHMGNGWYRCSATFNQQAGFEFFIGVASNDNLASYIDDGTGNIYVQYAQAESGSIATSYIPTNGSTVTRQADTANDAGNSQVFNDSQGVLFANIAANTDDLTLRQISLSDGTTSNQLVIYYGNGSNKIFYYLSVGGVPQVNDSVITSDIVSFNKIAFKYKQNDFQLWINGINVLSDSSGNTYPTSTLSQLNLTNGQGTGDYFYGKTKEIAYYDEILTDLELEYLTSYRSLNELVTELNLNEL